MLSNNLPSSTTLFSVSYREYAKTHFRKEFEKKYKGVQWEATEKSIFEDLRRLRMPNNKTQYSMQVDELKHKDEYWLIKYDFRIAGTKESTKTSGNRLVAVINNRLNKLEILVIYAKTDLPKNMGETAYLSTLISGIYPDVSKLF